MINTSNEHLPLIQFKNVSFQDVIKYPDLTIKRQHITFVTGKSGVGKSTLFRIINRTRPMTSGTVMFENKDLVGIKGTEVRKDILLVDQSPYLFDTSIKDNFIRFHELRENSVFNENDIEKYLQLMNIELSPSKAVHELSGGEKQRIFTAIHLSFKPKMILLDEPTASLDPKTSENVMRNIIHFCKQHTITPMVICHDHHLVEKLAEERIDL